MRKFTIQECQEFANTKKGECLSEYYFNSKTKMKWRCIEGHKWEACFGSIKCGSWCPKCAEVSNGVRLRLTIRDCKEWALQKGGECLEDEYVDNRVKMRWKCNQCNHEWKAQFGQIKMGSLCPNCAQNAKLSIVDCQRLAKCKNGECLEDGYVNAISKLRWKCNICTHIWEASYNTIQQGHWCPRCGDFKKC